MSFRIRDLMISVLPSAGGMGQGCPTCTGTTGQVGGCLTCTGTTGPITGPIGGCLPCTGTTGLLGGCFTCTGTTPALGDQRPQALAELRQQLQGLLSEVEAEEKRLEDAAFPQTAEEAEELEKRLEEALAEVRSRKGNLKKG